MNGASTPPAMPVSEVSPKPNKTLNAILQNVALGVGYVFVYWLLDWISGLYAPANLDVTPWNPTVAASLLLVFFKGLKWTPALFIASLSSQVFVESSPCDAPHIIVCLFETGVYATAAWFMRRRFLTKTEIEIFERTLTLCVVATIASGLMAIAYVLTFYAAHETTVNQILPLILEYWAGDALGLLLVVPAIFEFRQRKAFLSVVKTLIAPKNLARGCCVAAVVFVVYWAHVHNVHFFYVFFAPVLFVALTSGVIEVVVTVAFLFLNSLFWSWFFRLDAAITVSFLPFFSLALAWTGLVVSSLTQERHKSHLQIVKGNARLRALLDMYPDCVLIVDIADTIVAANSNFARLYGTTPEQLMDRPIASVIPAFTHTFNGETSLQQADGNFLPIDLSTSRVHVGEKYSSILTVRDITVRKQTETEQKERRAVSEQATRMHLTGGLAAALAHELNQPLSAIVSYVSACQKTLSQAESAPGKAVEQLQKIASQAIRAGNIIRRLREFYQNSNITLAPTPILPLIQETVMFLEDEIVKTNTAVEIAASEELIGLIDNVQIEQVMINLVRNSLEALKSMPVDQRKVRIMASKNVRGDIEVVVHDNGPGIPPEIADKLFSPFVTTRLSGMGLGLVICHSIIEAHEGRLWTEPQTSSGTKIHFTIPPYEKVQTV